MKNRYDLVSSWCRCQPISLDNMAEFWSACYYFDREVDCVYVLVLDTMIK